MADKKECACVNCNKCQGLGVKMNEKYEWVACEYCSGRGNFAKCFDHASAAGWLDAQDKNRYESYKRGI